MHGIGPSTSKKLKRIGIKLVSDLKNINDIKKQQILSEGIYAFTRLNILLERVAICYADEESPVDKDLQNFWTRILKNMVSINGWMKFGSVVTWVLIYVLPEQ